MNENYIEQHTIGWFRCRLGRITGSRVGDLMKSSRKAGEVFGETAKSYIYQLAAERAMNPDVINDDELFQMYLDQVDVTSKAMRWGNEQEGVARELYSKITDRVVEETGSCVHPLIPSFASSPDGMYRGDNEIGCLEIKCPTQAVFMRYVDEIHDNESLRQTKPEYFYQCMSHMMCTGAQWTDFIVFCPFQTRPMHIVRIQPDEKVFKEMEKRILLADDMINQIADL